MHKKDKPRTKRIDLVGQMNSSLSMLAQYLGLYAAALRNASAKPASA